MKINIISWWAMCALILGACDKDFIVDTSPKGAFESLFEYLKKDYAYRDYHAFSMEDLRQKYLPQIQANPTEESLAEIFLDIEHKELQDPHLYFNLSSSNYLLEASTKLYADDPSLNSQDSIPLWNEIDIIKKGLFYVHGIVKDNSDIGYMYINNFTDDIGGTSSLGIADGVAEINDIVQKLNLEGVKSMIVDMRSEAGGSNYIPRYIAQRFANRSAVYMVDHYPVQDMFKKHEWVIKPEGDYGFREGKIALLSNNNTCSGGEMFLLAMLQRDNLVHIGSHSKGCSGNVVDKDLSNGWIMLLTNSRTEYPDGMKYFKVGIEPSIIIENDDSYGITTFNDKVIEKAIEELK